MSVLRTKLRRDLRRNRAQFIGVMLTIACGIALFGGSYDSYHSLDASYRRLYAQLHFADFWVAGGNTQAFASRASATEGVAAVETRAQTELPLRVGADHTVLGAVIGVPTGRQPAVNRLLVMRGSYLRSGASPGVLLERHVADHFHIQPGDQVSLRGADGWHSLRVAGVVASAEYVWPAHNRQDVLTSPEDFGVVFAPEDLVRQLDGSSSITRVVVRYAPGAPASALDQQLRDLADTAGALDVYTRAEQPSNHALQEDVQGFGELSFLFPVLFLTAAGLGAWVILTRLVVAQRSIIGMMLAGGVRRRVVFRHYLAFGVAAAAGGVIPGAIAGVVLARLVAGAYTKAVDVPVTVLHISWSTPLIGLAFALMAGLLAAAAPAWRALRTEPAEAMRGPAPTGPGRRTLLERIVPPLRRLPSGATLVLRNAGRNGRRTATTALGVILACTLVLTAWGMIDTFDILVSRQIGHVQRDDARVTFSGTVTQARLATLRHVDGITAAEPILALPVGVQAHGKRYGTSLLAFQRGTTMHSFGSGGLPSQGILLGKAARSLLDIGSGDTVRVVVPGTSTPADVRVAGFVDEPLGTYAYASIQQVEQTARQQYGITDLSSVLPANTELVRYRSGVDRETMRERLMAVPGVTIVQDTHALLSSIHELLNLIFVLVGIMLAFGVVLAVALVYNTMSVNLAERSVEMATLEASGVEERRLARLITAENLLVALVAVGPGLLLGWLTGKEFMASFSDDQFNFSLVLHAFTPVAVAAGVLFVTWISQLPGLRSLRRLEIARIVRERSF